MPEIKTDDYEGGNRRNGGKLKLTLGEYIKFSLIVGGAVISVLYAWWTLNSNVNVNAQEIAEACEERREIIISNVQQGEDILTLQNDVTNIKEDVGEIKVVMKENSKLLHKILGRLE